MDSNDDVTFCATVDFFKIFAAFFNTFVDEAAKTGGGRRRGTTAAFAAEDDATTREDLLLPEEAVIFSLSSSYSFKNVSKFLELFCGCFWLIFEKILQKAVFFLFCEKRGTAVLVCMCV